MHFDVDRSNYSTTRVVDDPRPDTLQPGQVLLDLESFALTANNITYAVAGDMLDYWGFFPTDAPWGRIPVMGIGRVAKSAHPDIAEGGRYFGFFPMADHHVVDAAPSRDGFTDRAEHRAPHAATYRSFNLLDHDPAYHPDLDGPYLVARGLFITSFLVDDFLDSNDFFGATTVVVTSASSRTSLALAHRLRARDGLHVVGLTSPTNAGFAHHTGLYDAVLGYDDVHTLDAAQKAVVVDMSGNADVLRRVHTHFGEHLVHSCRVGATHWDAGGPVGDLPGATPAFFFAPTQIKVRSQEWGRDQFEAKIGAALTDFMRHAAGWMTVERSTGITALERVYRSTLAGVNDPSVGHVLTLSAGDRAAVTTDDVPLAQTPTGGWTEMPEPFLERCTEPLVAGAPDLRGTWVVVSVEAEGNEIPHHPALGKVQRIEQAGDRLIVTASGIVHDMRCDGSVERGVHDVAEFDRATPITVVATYEDGVHVLRPVGLPIEVTRRIEGEQMVWTYVGFTARLDRIDD